MYRDIFIIIIASVVLAGLVVAGAVILAPYITLQCLGAKRSVVSQDAI